MHFIVEQTCRHGTFFYLFGFLCQSAEMLLQSISLKQRQMDCFPSFIQKFLIKMQTHNQGVNRAISLLPEIFKNISSSSVQQKVAIILPPKNISRLRPCQNGIALYIYVVMHQLTCFS